MLDLWGPQGTLPLLEQVAAFGERRQQVLAGNIANIDTPAYRTRDLPVSEFQNALRERIQSKQMSARSSPMMSQNSQPPASGPLPPELFQAREIPSKSQTFQDGNNRSIELELTEMTKNSMLQRYSIQLMNAQTNLLQAVISERP